MSYFATFTNTIFRAIKNLLTKLTFLIFALKKMESEVDFSKLRIGGPENKDNAVIISCCGLNGYDSEGFDKRGFDKDGYKTDGFHKATNRDRDGFSRAGYNKEGFNRDGFNKSGHGF